MTTGLALKSRKDAREKPLTTEGSLAPGQAANGPGAWGTSTGLPMRAAYLISDLLAITVSFATTLAAARWLLGADWQSLGIIELKVFGVLGVALLVVAGMQRSYASIPPRPARQFRGWVLGALAAVVVEIASLWLFGIGARWHLLALLVATALTIVTSAFNRAMCRALFGRCNWWGTRLVVIGSEGLAASVLQDMQREPQWGLRPVGFVDDSPGLQEGSTAAGCIGALESLDALSEEWRFTHALVTVDAFNAQELAELMYRAGGQIRHWLIMPSLDSFPCMWLDAVEAARRPALAVTNRLALPTSYAVKRGFDLTVTLSLGIVLLPLFACLWLLVRCTSRGPVFYGQQRIGRRGRRFTAWKFRTMVPNAASVLDDYLAQHPELSTEWEATHKLKNDPRVTTVGHWLRVLSLDELPQIWNVIVGEMSLVGPRPIVSEEIDKYADRYRHYMQVLPGVTGMWQVSGRNNTTYEERVDLDAYYVENWSLWLDLYILACTVKVVVLGEGAY